MDMQQESTLMSGTCQLTMLFLLIMEKKQGPTLLCNTNWANRCNAPENGAWTRKRMNGGFRLSGNGDHDSCKKMKPYICVLKQIK
jgi:hypothetical protein